MYAFLTDRTREKNAWLCSYFLSSPEELVVIYLSISYLHWGRNFQKMYLTTVYKELKIEWALNSYHKKYYHNWTKQATWLWLCASIHVMGWNKSSLNLVITNLYQKKPICMILHCTSMNIVVDSFPQVLFAMHLYSPLWFLLMLMIVSSFPLVTWPVLTFFQETLRGGVPAVTLHSFVTFLPSSTVTFCISSTATGTGRDEWEKGVFF